MPRKRTKQPSREHESMKRGNHEVGDAIRRIEQIEDELNEKDGMEDLRERLTDARADLVDSLVQEALTDQQHEDEMDAAAGVEDDIAAYGEMSIRGSDRIIAVYPILTDGSRSFLLSSESRIDIWGTESDRGERILEAHESGALPTNNRDELNRILND